MEKERRIVYIDIAKGIGIILIVLMHVLRNGYLRQFISSFIVSLFFFLSGLTYSSKEDKKYFWFNKFNRIYVPYIIFSLVSICIFSLIGSMASRRLNIELMDGTVLDNIWGMVYGNSRTGFMKWNTPIWFLPCLMAVYLLIDTVEGCSKSNRFKLRIITIGISLILTGIYTTLFRHVKLPFAAETAIFMYSFFEMGIMFKESKKMQALRRFSSKHRTVSVLTGMFCFIIVSALSYVNGSAQVRTMVLGNNGILFLLESIFGILGVLFLSAGIENLSFIAYLGRHTMPILLMHKFPVLFFQTIMPGTKVLLKNGNNTSGIIVAFFVTAVSVTGCLIIGKVMGRICPKAIGM